MRRKFDEIKYKPMVGLLMADMRIKPHYLDCSQDKFADPIALPEVPGVDLEDFVSELRDMADQALDFRAAVRRACDAQQLPKSVVQIVMGAVENVVR
jgi:hypothetical protein